MENRIWEGIKINGYWRRFGVELRVLSIIRRNGLYVGNMPQKGLKMDGVVEKCDTK